MIPISINNDDDVRTLGDLKNIIDELCNYYSPSAPVTINDIFFYIEPID